MSTSRVVFRGVASNWLGNVCAIAITFFITPIIIRGLGDEAYGLWSMVMSLSVYYALSNMGLRAAGVKYISQFEAVDDREQVNKVVVAMLAAYVPVAVCVLMAATCIAFAFPYFVATEQIQAATIRWVIIVSGASVSIGIIGEVFAAILVALKRFDQINVLGVGSQLLQAVLIAAAILNGAGLMAMAWIILLVTTLRQVWTAWLAFRAAPFISLSLRLFVWATLKMLLGFGLLNVLVAAARRMNQYGGTIIIGLVQGPVAVTFYAIASSLANKVEDLGQGVNSVLMPVVSQLDAQKRRGELHAAFFLTSRTLLAVSLAVGTVFVALGKPLIALWITPEHAEASYGVLCLLAVAMAVRMPSTSAANVLKGTARMRPLVRVATFEALLTLALGILLVNIFGLLGMAYATVFSQALIACLLVPLTCRVIGAPLTGYVIKATLPGVIAALPGMAVACALWSWLPPTRLLHVILQAGLICAITAVAIVLVCFDEHLRSSILGRLGKSRRREFPTTATEPDLEELQPELPGCRRSVSK
jgi:O-antigen/teichoic acid export membrane protein